MNSVRMVPCPSCGATAGEQCSDLRTNARHWGAPIQQPHRARLTAARELASTARSLNVQAADLLPFIANGSLQVERDGTVTHEALWAFIRRGGSDV